MTKVYLKVTLPPIILKAGIPRINISRAKTLSQFGQTHGITVKFLTIRALKHLIKATLFN